MFPLNTDSDNPTTAQKKKASTTVTLPTDDNADDTSFRSDFLPCPHLPHRLSLISFTPSPNSRIILHRAHTPRRKTTLGAERRPHLFTISVRKATHRAPQYIYIVSPPVASPASEPQWKLPDRLSFRLTHNYFRVKALCSANCIRSSGPRPVILVLTPLFRA